MQLLTWAAPDLGRFRLPRSLPQLPHLPGWIPQICSVPVHKGSCEKLWRFLRVQSLPTFLSAACEGKGHALASLFGKRYPGPGVPNVAFPFSCAALDDVLFHGLNVRSCCGYRLRLRTPCDFIVCTCSRSPPAAPASNGTLAGQPGQLQRAGPGSGSSNSGSQPFTPKVCPHPIK